MTRYGVYGFDADDNWVEKRVDLEADVPVTDSYFWDMFDGEIASNLYWHIIVYDPEVGWLD